MAMKLKITSNEEVRTLQIHMCIAIKIKHFGKYELKKAKNVLICRRISLSLKRTLPVVRHFTLLCSSISP
jgi:hypothetical protein